MPQVHYVAEDNLELLIFPFLFLLPGVSGLDYAPLG